MSKLERTFDFDDCHMRLITLDDIEAYFKVGFACPDEEVNYFTGTTGTFTQAQVEKYVQSVVSDSSRYDYLIMQRGRIIGEVVLSDIDNAKCHYRICIFEKGNFSKGIGKQATQKVLELAFEVLKLDAVELEVFPFNERGLALYRKMGFEITGEIVDSDAKEPFRNICTMALKASRYQNIKYQV